MYATHGLPMQIPICVLYICIMWVFLSPGRLIKKVWRDVVDRDFVSFMVLFLITCVIYFIMRRAPMRDCVV